MTKEEKEFYEKVNDFGRPRKQTSATKEQQTKTN